jgi:hypothetical protein
LALIARRGLLMADDTFIEGPLYEKRKKVNRDDAGAIAIAGLPSTLVLGGWSARAAASLMATFANGGQIAASGERGGIGGNAGIWTYRARFHTVRRAIEHFLAKRAPLDDASLLMSATSAGPPDHWGPSDCVYRKPHMPLAAGSPSPSVPNTHYFSGHPFRRVLRISSR